MFRCAICNNKKVNKECSFMPYTKRKGSTEMGICVSCLILSKALKTVSVIETSKIFNKLNFEVTYGQKKT